MDEVTKINRTNGKIIWRWGGKHNYFQFKGDTLQFSQQHDVRRIPNGHITVFDNGNFRKIRWGDDSIHDTTFSRAIEYDLDESSLKATAVWQYTDFPVSYAGGNVERLANGHTFIGLGFRDLPNAIEVTQKGEKVFQLSILQPGSIYRTYRFEYPMHSSVVRVPYAGNTLGIQSINPNPAHTSANVTFSVMESGHVYVDILNILGQSVRRFGENISDKGIYSTSLNINELSEGTYYCKLSQNGRISVKLLVVQK